MKYLMLLNRWFASYNFAVWIIYLKGLFLHPNVSEFHLLSYLGSPPPLFPFIDTLGDDWSRDSWKSTITNYFMKLRILLLLLWY